MTRRVRPGVLRHRIVARLEREREAVTGRQDRGELQVSPEWVRGYLSGLWIARVIVREGGE